MENFFTEWLILLGVMFVGLASPGPDFVIAVRNSILHSRKAGIFTALGFAFGVLVHVFYCLVGLAALISQSIVLFNIIKFLGAGYLIYIGFKALHSKGFEAPEIEGGALQASIMTPREAFVSGFITNVLNPKATFFFMALFTQIIDPSVPHSVQILYGATCFVMTFLWFSFVALFLTVPAIRERFLRAAKWIDRVCGAALIALGIRLALTKLN